MIEFTGPAVLEPAEAQRRSASHRESQKWHVNHAPYPRVYHVALRRDDEGAAVTAYCLELPGAITEADDGARAEQQLRDVITELLDEYRRSGQSAPWVAREPEAGDEIVGAFTVNG